MGLDLISPTEETFGWISVEQLFPFARALKLTRPLIKTTTQTNNRFVS